MQFTTWASGLVFALAVLALLATLNRWARHSSNRGVERAVADEEKRALFELSGLNSLLDAILGNRTWPRRRYFRSLVVSTLLLLAVLGLAGVQTNAFLAVEAPPWTAYQQSVNQMLAVRRSAYEKADPSEKANQKRQVELLTLASAPKWKWVYSAVLVIGLWFTNWVTLLWMMKSTRHFLRDHRGPGTPTQKASALFACAFISFLTAVIVLPILSLLASPIGLAVLLVIILLHSIPWLLLLAVVVVGYWLEWSTAAPSLLATVATCTLPAAAFLVLTVPALVKKTVVAAARERAKQLALSASQIFGLNLQVSAIVIVLVWIAWEMLRFFLPHK
jgi:hypothetical protein